MKNRQRYLLFLAGLVTVLGAASYGGWHLRLDNLQWMWRGNWAYRHRAYGDAEVCFRQALQKEPGFAPAFYQLGNALYQQGRYREAIGCFQQAQRHSGPALEAALWNNLGNAYYRSGRLDQSQWAYQNALVTSIRDQAIRQDFLFVQRALAQRLSSQKPPPKDNPANGPQDGKKEAAAKASKQGTKQQIDSQDKGTQQALSRKTMEDIFDQINANETQAESKLNKGRQLGKKVASDAKDY